MTVMVDGVRETDRRGLPPSEISRFIPTKGWPMPHESNPLFSPKPFCTHLVSLEGRSCHRHIYGPIRLSVEHPKNILSRVQFAHSSPEAIFRRRPQHFVPAISLNEVAADTSMEVEVRPIQWQNECWLDGLSMVSEISLSCIRGPTGILRALPPRCHKLYAAFLIIVDIFEYIGSSR